MRPVLRRLFRRLAYFGSSRYCPVCQKSSRKFMDYSGREGVECVHCGSFERHRLLWLFFAQRPELLSTVGQKFLHVAPERCIRSRLAERIGAGYLSADLTNSAMVRMDICDIKYPDGTFDAILCSHVLEHVDDDRRAMREFRRVLKPGGWAVLLVPILAERTYEDFSITEPAGRLAAFGQSDHVRIYGPDYVDRLRESGWVVETVRTSDLANQQAAERMGIARNTGDIHFCY